MDGVALGARFSIATNRLQYCGAADAAPALYRAIVAGRDDGGGARALTSFEALMPYLELIARKHDRSPFDAEVVEAYWIGNDLLEAFDRADFLRLLDALVQRGLPRSLAAPLREHLPRAPLPHHAFHVSYVGVGNVTGHVATTLANMELCRPAWARVTAVGPDRLLVEKPSLVLSDGQLSLGPIGPAEVTYDPTVLPGIEPGADVALHWRWAALALRPAQRRFLEEYSRRAFAAASEGLAGLPALRESGP
jgi:hypothetical protein